MRTDSQAAGRIVIATADLYSFDLRLPIGFFPGTRFPCNEFDQLMIRSLHSAFECIDPFVLDALQYLTVGKPNGLHEV